MLPQVYLGIKRDISYCGGFLIVELISGEAIFYGQGSLARLPLFFVNCSSGIYLLNMEYAAQVIKVSYSTPLPSLKLGEVNVAEEWFLAYLDPRARGI